MTCQAVNIMFIPFNPSLQYFCIPVPLPSALPPLFPYGDAHFGRARSDQPYFCFVPETKPSALGWARMKWGKVCRGGENVPFVAPLPHSLYLSISCLPLSTPRHPPLLVLQHWREWWGREGGGWLVHSASVKRFHSGTMPGRSRQVQAREREEWRERQRERERGREQQVDLQQAVIM